MKAWSHGIWGLWSGDLGPRLRALGFRAEGWGILGRRAQGFAFKLRSLGSRALDVGLRASHLSCGVWGLER